MLGSRFLVLCKTSVNRPSKKATYRDHSAAVPKLARPNPKGRPVDYISDITLSRFVVIPEYNLLFCLIEKVGRKFTLSCSVVL